ncbi:tetratricopeptide repeat protein [Helicobacter pylori]|uniref:tetratricopeptide repeat protein n=1 Tax=Helicobacter pylori TaxID=210 RepID=UPI001E3CE75D|nr:tetratricopeptide repeat protein [Helicobacter pylori]
MLGFIGGGLMASQTPKELVDLGMLSYDKQDFSKARKYFERACGLNNGRGCNNLGVLYRDGQGVEKNLTKAAQFYSKACDLNNGVGCKNLGFLYEYGKGVEKDLTKAAYFYSKACKLGDQKACEALKEK